LTYFNQVRTLVWGTLRLGWWAISDVICILSNLQTYLNELKSALLKYRRIIRLVAVGNEPFLPENRNEAMPYIEAAFNKMVSLVAEIGLSNFVKVRK
jgi:hypothetical protein